ncbi:hypothetical protein D9611_004718 [Ephemerocybe angulata]|uniref:Nuclear speckle splicing regulatory protein 1 N-terminal domain-containing protein n=1 Tax=Ephemerocybe angulata TaxID=980116 RepID=A0A8H5EX67_9AGAR|nr:hypothetical protein D9611_004718 [Tulosesus angulatus]
MKLSISLKKKPENPLLPSVVAKPKPSLFNDADTEEVVAPTPGAYNVQASKAMRKRIEAEKQVDSTVYEYDEVWDRMQVAKQKAKEAKEVESLERKPKYINSLLNAAATRKLDHQRAEEKMMQRERELEGDEFKDKESFVTQGYAEQLVAMRKAEEEEKQREEQEKKQRGATSGMTHFYKKLLEESEQQHEATVAAAEKRVFGPQAEDPSNLTITKPPDFTPQSDLELAKLAREQGKEVELNDDNQIVDKRELLTAGLNLALPNTRNLALKKALEAKGGAQTEEVQAHRAVGAAASRKEINERRAREVRKQMEEEERRVEEKKREEEAESLRRTVQKRNTTDDVMSAKERYLQRKRARLEQAAVSSGETQ